MPKPDPTFWNDGAVVIAVVGLCVLGFCHLVGSCVDEDKSKRDYQIRKMELERKLPCPETSP